MCPASRSGRWVCVNASSLRLIAPPAPIAALLSQRADRRCLPDPSAPCASLGAVNASLRHGAVWPCFFFFVTDGHSGSVHKGCRTLQVIQSTLPYTAGHPVHTAVHCRSSTPDCRVLQVIQTAVHCRSSRLSCTAGHPDCRVLQIIQAAMHCRSSRLPCTAGHPGCCVLQVIHAAVHCRSSRLPCTAGHPVCRVLQVQAAVYSRTSRLPINFLGTGVSTGHN